ncbi:MAG: hypothetical protein HY695_26995 [Deltaproteobacteria bacterium]|nr:hypothetical protein [Deltaproteobacteria bacterium]
MRVKKILCQLRRIVIIGFLFMLTFSVTTRGEENPLLAPSSVEARAEGPLNLLKGFALVPGAAVMAEGGYVIALFKNPRTGLYALVSFTADCDSQGCTIKDLVTYTLFGADDIDLEFAQA